MRSVVLNGLVLLILCAGCTLADDRPAETGRVTAECRAKGKPVTLDLLERTFQANGISLEINAVKCVNPGASPFHASNFGPTGREVDRAVEAREGNVACDIANGNNETEIQEIHNPGDNQTYLRILNIQCMIYASEGQQIANLRRAMKALVPAVAAKSADF